MFNIEHLGENKMSRTGIMLAYPFEERRLEKWKKPFIIQPKLDGDRCRVIYDEFGKVTLLSSEENQINSVPHIVDQLESRGLANIELDGELYVHGALHQLIHGAVSRTTNLHPEFESVELHLFDYVDLSMSQAERSVKLESLEIESNNVTLVKSDLANTVEDVMSYLNKYTEMGYEGVILRNIQYPYLRKRSTGMMKFKPRKSDFYTIIGYSIEIDKNKHIKEGVLGRIICASNESPTGLIGDWSPYNKIPDGCFGIGSGSFLTMENRKYLWKNRNNIVGKTAHIKYQHLTTNRVPRFPVLVDIIGIGIV
jgi:ATP-dependent DNA ligase